LLRAHPRWAHPYGALPIKGWEEKIRKDHIKALDKGDLVLIIFGPGIELAMADTIFEHLKYQLE
jgi:hypothetical protein